MLREARLANTEIGHRGMLCPIKPHIIIHPALRHFDPFRCEFTACCAPWLCDSAELCILPVPAVSERTRLSPLQLALSPIKMFNKKYKVTKQEAGVGLMRVDHVAR